MKLIRGLHNLHQLDATVVTIGNFDGVHLGHQSLLQDVKRLAAQQQLPAVLLIFEPHPLEFFLQARAPARLMKLREKLEALRPFAIDYVVCLSFNEILAAKSPHDFVSELLVARLGCRTLVVGDDFRFGKQRAGDVALLKQLGAQYHFTVLQLPTYEQAHDRVSSTRIRQALAAGELALAAQLLGRPYSMIGKVVHGAKLGRQLGFPTANLYLQRQVVALQGVFVVRARVNKEASWHYGAANLGTRPAVAGERILLEVYLFDFNRDIYAHNLEVQFLHKLREEQPCEGLDALKAMIAKDVSDAQAWLSQHNPYN